MLRLFLKLPIAIAGAVLFLLMVLTFCDVILRSAFNAPIEAATELTKLGVALVVFAALPAISYRGDHIAVDLLDPLFKNPFVQRLRDGLIAIACGVMLIWPTQYVQVLAERARGFGDRTEYLEIPQFIVGYFIFAMCCLTIAALILKGVLLLVAPRFVEDVA
ncbi:TRAP transporter small permease [Sulfitobacter albidus]|uniref:TRAP transporter small permease protein n=1 Tax=Sulfitobacter albidus TaxID=2829501 RepID=A0A975JH50_9RHOB|nr:TRAP transporter small permease subunit [Sulfitobacter albidus]QUJ78419.1 TRAP transporter small permease [Sulfitobacter albidus]